MVRGSWGLFLFFLPEELQTPVRLHWLFGYYSPMYWQYLNDTVLKIVLRLLMVVEKHSSLVNIFHFLDWVVLSMPPIFIIIWHSWSLRNLRSFIEIFLSFEHLQLFVHCHSTISNNTDKYAWSLCLCSTSSDIWKRLWYFLNLTSSLLWLSIVSLIRCFFFVGIEV